MARLLHLDEAGSRDPDVAGGKAAWLARARAAGLPALPGYVVPVAQSMGAFGPARDALSSGGSGAARMAITEAALADELIAALRDAASDLGDALIVRSSSPLESEGAWSGAFTSYRDIRPQDLPIAVRGCWASAFSVDALERWETTGLAIEQLSLAVLIQPHLLLDAGGSATIAADGSLRLVGVRGSPEALMAGWDPGVEDDIGADDEIHAGDAVSLLGEEIVRSVVALGRRARDEFGPCLIEWGFAAGTVHLLQLQPRAAGPASLDAAPPREALPRALASAAALRVARQVQRYPGALAQTLVLPWLLGMAERPDAVVPPAALEPKQALEEAKSRAGTLTAAAWGLPAEEALAAAQRLLLDMHAADPAAALERADHLQPVDDDEAAQVLGLFESVAAALVQRGVLSDAPAFWRHSLDQIDELLETGAPPPSVGIRLPASQWEPFLRAVATLQGERRDGQAASPGLGAGRVCLIRDKADAESFRPRDVVVAPFPVPWLAPLLWNAAGLITSGGSAAAHLCEVARWLRVPAVVGCRYDDAVRAAIDDQANAALVVAVDGDRGAASFLPL